jgi:hypothetical protein
VTGFAAIGPGRDGGQRLIGVVRRSIQATAPAKTRVDRERPERPLHLADRPLASAAALIDRLLTGRQAQFDPEPTSA